MKGFWPQDNEDYLLNDASWDKIPSVYLPLIEDIKSTYIKYVADKVYGIYIFGSVPRGIAKQGLSDIDCMAVLKSKVNTEWAYGESMRIMSTYPIISSIVFDFALINEVIETKYFSWPAFLLSIGGLCIQGKDIIPSLPRFKPRVEICNSELIQLKENIDEAIQEIKKSDSVEKVKYWCRRITKNMLRDGFFLHMVKDNRFTSDVDLCYQEFAKHYPHHAAEMARALEFSKNPSSHKTEIIDFLNGFGRWLVAEADKWLGIQNV